MGHLCIIWYVSFFPSGVSKTRRSSSTLYDPALARKVTKNSPAVGMTKSSRRQESFGNAAAELRRNHDSVLAKETVLADDPENVATCNVRSSCRGGHALWECSGLKPFLSDRDDDRSSRRQESLL